MCASMVDIQSATAENKKKKIDRKKKKPQDKNMMSASAMQGGCNKNMILRKVQLCVVHAAHC